MSPEERESSFPVLSLGREDLLYCRPDLKAQIDALAEADIARLADKVGDALQDSYWMAVETVLGLYLDNDAEGKAGVSSKPHE